MACDEWWMCIIVALAMTAITVCVPLLLYWLWSGLPG